MQRGRAAPSLYMQMKRIWKTNLLKTGTPQLAIIGETIALDRQL
jgi:hypothetical protein